MPDFDPYRPAPNAPAAIRPAGAPLISGATPPATPGEIVTQAPGAPPSPPRTDALTPVEPAGFWTGAAAPWKGLGYLVRHPASWPFAMVPMAVAGTLFVIISAIGFVLIRTKIHERLSMSTGVLSSVLLIVVEVLATLLVLFLGFVAALFLTQPLAGPALQRLVIQFERGVGLPERPATPFLLDMWRGARSALVGSLSLPITLVLTLVDVIWPAAAIVTWPVKILVMGYFIAWDLLDYPLSVRGWRLRDRFRWLRTHKALVLGFGGSLALLFLIPLMQLLLLPVGVVGATWLVWRAEQSER